MASSAPFRLFSTGEFVKIFIGLSGYLTAGGNFGYNNKKEVFS
jgi:hypothetical protein